MVKKVVFVFMFVAGIVVSASAQDNSGGIKFPDGEYKCVNYALANEDWDNMNYPALKLLGFLIQ